MLTVDPEIWRLYPGLRLVLVWADSIDNRTERPRLPELLDERSGALREGWTRPNPQSHPNIAAWRAAAKAAGFSGKKFPSSIEALARRVLTGRGVGSINPLVDLYNSVSLAHVVPAGGWDLDDLGGGRLRLGRTAGGERFRELGSEAEIEVGPGEVSYLIDDQVVTRHFVWRQSNLGKLTGGTCRALLVSEILREVAEDEEAVVELARRVETELLEGLETYLGCRAESAIVTAESGPLGAGGLP